MLKYFYKFSECQLQKKQLLQFFTYRFFFILRKLIIKRIISKKVKNRVISFSEKTLKYIRESSCTDKFGYNYGIMCYRIQNSNTILARNGCSR